MSDIRPLDVTAHHGAAPTDGWLIVLRRYMIAIVLGNLVWEIAQLPLYTIWYEGTAGKILFAILHCTAGDVLIASAALIASLLALADGRWPQAGYRSLAIVAVVGGLGYTIYSEWLNTGVRGNWAYTQMMPQLPLIGTGLSPLVQWLIVPSLAFWWARRPLSALARQNRRTP
ncbi:MAG: hypothetical protein F9K44_05870 [Hyphomicrobiaceae bacterium]|nr:MAG: hypothetical protein F9K44_05870 [Hyphomicrobiaceae bacterium]